ncbi:MAG: hypothetical protein ACREVY_17005 [Gammaproteobacteria bacterium]
MSSKTFSRTTRQRALLSASIRALRTGEPTDHPTRRIARERRSTEIVEALSASRASQELEHVRWVRAVARQRRQAPGRRKLDRYRQEIAALWKQGASVRDIAVWLRVRKRTKVHASTVHRYLKGLAVE